MQSQELDIRHPSMGSPSEIFCIGLKKLDGPASLRGFCDLHIPAWRLQIFGCPINEDRGKRWVGLPGKPWLDAAGNLVRDPETGKPRYSPVLQFDDQERLRAFRQAAVEAVLAYDPDAFGGR
ncbi:hypothetical protein [Ensifer sp. MJa1]|uniref:hypothetical protein n=1 Tax=Ensifer sp. MJa1 TaxID=2919888 RepID=UPI00300B1F5C